LLHAASVALHSPPDDETLTVRRLVKWPDFDFFQGKIKFSGLSTHANALKLSDHRVYYVIAHCASTIAAPGTVGEERSDMNSKRKNKETGSDGKER
jgi:hypothetical protein